MQISRAKLETYSARQAKVKGKGKRKEKGEEDGKVKANGRVRG